MLRLFINLIRVKSENINYSGSTPCHIAIYCCINFGISFQELKKIGTFPSYPRYREYENAFGTPSGKIELFSRIMEHAGASPLPIYREPPFSSVPAKPDNQFPLTSMSGTKIMPFFHSELRQIDALRKENPDPLLEIHPDTAASLGIVEDDWVWVESPWNRVKLQARLFDGIAPDVVNAQHAWWFPEDKPPEYG